MVAQNDSTAIRGVLLSAFPPDSPDDADQEGAEQQQRGGFGDGFHRFPGNALKAVGAPSEQYCAQTQRESA